jgi:uncharacterized membrane protein
MKRSILVYSRAVASGAFLPQWLEYQYTVRIFSTEIYVVIIALLFTALGVWAGHKLAAPNPKEHLSRNPGSLYGGLLCCTTE